jgi:Fe-S-cluster containining protein
VQINTDLLQKISSAAARNLDSYLQKALTASAEHGAFGMQMLDQLHEQLPRTRCNDCGKCCNSISIFSLEYHRLIREVMTTWPPERLRRLVHSALRFDLRQAEVADEKRLRCIFRDDESKVCLVHPVRPFACRIFGLLKEDGTRECQHVKDLRQPETVVTQDYLISLQAKVLENSESYQPFPDGDEIHFFPFEFWFFRHIFTPERAMQIYREILVPMSSPLTRLWQKHIHLPPPQKAGDST